jgi:hypothetical protein
MPAMMHGSMHGRETRGKRRSRQAGEQGQSNELASYCQLQIYLGGEPNRWLAVF